MIPSKAEFNDNWTRWPSCVVQIDRSRQTRLMAASRLITWCARLWVIVSSCRWIQLLRVSFTTQSIISCAHTLLSVRTNCACYLCCVAFLCHPRTLKYLATSHLPGACPEANTMHNAFVPMSCHVTPAMHWGTVVIRGRWSVTAKGRPYWLSLLVGKILKPSDMDLFLNLKMGMLVYWERVFFLH